MHQLTLYSSKRISFYSIFIEPYKEAFENGSLAFAQERLYKNERGDISTLDLSKRVIRFGLSILLILPVINTIISLTRYLYFIKTHNKTSSVENASQKKFSQSNHISTIESNRTPIKIDSAVAHVKIEQTVSQTTKTLNSERLSDLDEASNLLTQKLSIIDKKISSFIDKYPNTATDDYLDDFKKLLKEINKYRIRLLEDTERYKAACIGIQLLEKISSDVVKEVKSKLLNYFIPSYPPLTDDHIKRSTILDQELIKKDQLITEIPTTLIFPKTLDDDNVALIKGHFPPETIFPKLSYVQLPGLDQDSAQNYLCGYYALFFLLQQVRVFNNPSLKIEELVQDRASFNKCFKEWREIIWKYKIGTLDYKNIRLEPEIRAEINALTPYLLSELISKSPLLEPVRQSNNSFILDLEEYYHVNNSLERAVLIEDPLLILRPIVADQKLQFPCFMIVKKTDHYIVVHVEEVKENDSSQILWKLSVVHSLNYSIYSKEFGLNMLYNIPLALFTSLQNKKFSTVPFVDVNIEPTLEKS